MKETRIKFVEIILIYGFGNHGILNEFGEIVYVCRLNQDAQLPNILFHP